MPVGQEQASTKIIGNPYIFSNAQDFNTYQESQRKSSA